MNNVFIITICILASTAFSSTLANATKHVEVYAISQHYWDVAAGETLSGIVKQLLPDNPGLRKKLLFEIVALNPDAFSLNNPDNLKANIRLWLPNHSRAMRSTKKHSQSEIQSFSWGQVYKARR